MGINFKEVKKDKIYSEESYRNKKEKNREIEENKYHIFCKGVGEVESEKLKLND